MLDKKCIYLHEKSVEKYLKQYFTMFYHNHHKNKTQRKKEMLEKK